MNKIKIIFLFFIELNRIANEIQAKIPAINKKLLLKKYEYKVVKNDKKINMPDILCKNCI
jgi:hypothetical protein